MKNTEGTVAVLQLIDSIQKSFVNSDSTNKDRLVNAIFVVQFCRIWLQWLQNEDRPDTEFISQNAFEGLEINAVLIINLLLSNKLEFIPIMSSQMNEKFFRTLRSYTGVEHLDVNCSIKGFASRVQRMQCEEILMNDLESKYTFPTLTKRAMKMKEHQVQLEETEIQEYIQIGIDKAVSYCSLLGMTVPYTDLKQLVTKVDSWVSNEEEIIDDDHLECENDELQENIDDEDDSYEIMQLKNMELDNKKSSKCVFFFYKIIVKKFNSI